MKKNLMSAIVATIILLIAGAAHANALKSKHMTQVPYSGAGAPLLSMGSAAESRAFFEQDFKKMTLEQKEFVAKNLLREIVFFNIGQEIDIGKMQDNEREIYINKAITNPIHNRTKIAIHKVVKDILESTEFNVEKNPHLVNSIKSLLVQVDLLIKDEKSFNFVNDYRASRFEVVEDSSLNDAWKKLFTSSYGPTITPQAYVMYETFEKQYTTADVDKMFEALKAKKQ